MEVDKEAERLAKEKAEWSAYKSTTIELGSPRYDMGYDNPNNEQKLGGEGTENSETQETME